MYYFKILLALLYIMISSAHAESDPLQANPESPWYALNAETGWHYDLGVGVEYEPGYAGSDEYEQEGDLFARVLYRTDEGHRYFVSLGEIGGIFSISPEMQFQAFFEYEEARDDDDEALDGLDDVDSTIEGQFMLARRFGNSTIFGVLQPDLTGDANKGLVWFVGASHDWFINDNQWRVGTRFDISGADTEHMRTEFGITVDESTRTGYDEYAPDGGIKSATFGLSSEYWFTSNMSLLGSLEAEYYLDEASDSPLIEDEGSDITYETSLLLRWQF